MDLRCCAVRDYAIALFSPQELQELQRKVVDAFTAARPADPIPTFPTLKRWPIAPQAGDVSAAYVKHQIEHHLRCGLDLSAQDLPPCVERWLCHVCPYDWISPTDCIPYTLLRVLGEKRIIAIGRVALEAAEVNDYLVFVTLWYGWIYDRFRKEGLGVFLQYKQYKEAHDFFPSELAWPSITRLCLGGQRPPNLAPEEDAYVSLQTTVDFAWWFAREGRDGIHQWAPWITDEDFAGFLPRAVHLLETTEAGRHHTTSVEQLKEVSVMKQLQDEGDFTRLYPIKLKRAQVESEKILQDVDLHKLMQDDYVWSGAYALMHLKEWSWDWMEQVDVLALLQSYDFDHADHMKHIGWHLPHLAFLPALRGDIRSANACFDIALDILRRMMANMDGPFTTVFKPNILSAISHCTLPSLLVLLGRSDDAAAIMNEVGTTWSTADACADEHGRLRTGARERGSTERNSQHYNSVEDIAWRIKLQYVRCTTWRDVPMADIVAALPSPDLLEGYITTVGINVWRTGRYTCGSLQLQAASVCIKLERYADALLYLDKALRIDPNDPTTDRRAIVQAEGQTMRGRVLAAQGKKVEAEAAFEEAVEVSHRTGLRLFEMLALRDLKRHILDSDGRGEEGTKRLKAVLCEMKGPPAELTKLLGDGLDAEAILRS
eukprot:COSAG06_NODE_6437_length_2933_cov_7.770995_2_plen_659_part_00